MDNQEQKEMMSKLWHKDISNMTHAEIQDIVQNMFYQIFLVEVTNFQFGIVTDDFGTRVNFVVTGEAYRDAEGLDASEKIDMMERGELEE